MSLHYFRVLLRFTVQKKQKVVHKSIYNILVFEKERECGDTHTQTSPNQSIAVNIYRTQIVTFIVFHKHMFIFSKRNNGGGDGELKRNEKGYL